MNLVLNDRSIKSLFDRGMKIIDPFDEDSLQPASIDLRLGNIHYKYDFNQYVLGENIDKNKVKKEVFKELTLESGETAFIGLYEKMTIPDTTMGIIFPRSSITRLGIQIVTTYMNPGYSGNMPITIINHTKKSIIIKPNFRVVQLVLLSLSNLPNNLYKDIKDSKYYNENVDYSKLHADKEVEIMLDEILEKEAPVLHGMSKRLQANES